MSFYLSNPRDRRRVDINVQTEWLREALGSFSRLKYHVTLLMMQSQVSRWMQAFITKPVEWNLKTTWTKISRAPARDSVLIKLEDLCHRFLALTLCWRHLLDLEKRSCSGPFDVRMTGSSLTFQLKPRIQQAESWGFRHNTVSFAVYSFSLQQSLDDKERTKQKTVLKEPYIILVASSVSVSGGKWAT